MRTRTIMALAGGFCIGVAVGRGFGPSAATAQGPAPANPYGEMLHVGIVVNDLEKAVEQWRAIGFRDIRVLPPSKGVDRIYHGKPIDAALKQAFIHGTSPAIELIEPVGDAPSPWRDFLRRHGAGLHHLAYRIPDTGRELEKYRKLGLRAIAEGKWPEGSSHWGTFDYVQGPEPGVIIEFIGRVPRR